MQENTDWYNSKGECDENGCYDAGGHFYAERAAEIYDYVSELQKPEPYDQTI